uniref:Uncharacterized protein n=1 Tax=Conchiformibius kuhniae TaxID=211502 RepID=A0A8T9MVL2_9NEIS|nr:hypothetical protein LVJ77_09000 [Conchiformibius kuhniae]
MMFFPFAVPPSRLSGKGEHDTIICFALIRTGCRPARTKVYFNAAKGAAQ